MAEDSSRIRIGYALSPKKLHTLIQPSLLNLSKERGINLFPIQLSKPLLDQGPFDCIIHKLYDSEWINQLQQLALKQPNVVIIDPPDAIERLNSRITMLEVVNQVTVSPPFTLGIPRQVFVESPERLPHLDSNALLTQGMKFPVIAKPVASDGNPDSHSMKLVLKKEGLEILNMNPPFVLQEFINHGGVIFKVYVVGEHIECVKRRSLPDVPTDGVAIQEIVVPFSQISNSATYNQNDENVKRALEGVEMPPSSFVNEVALQLREALKLNLFNFDMIRDSRFEDRYVVIDINYFPGYAKMPGFEKTLTDFFLEIVQSRRV